MSTETPPPPMADRGPPPAIAPLIKDGVRYEQKIGGTADGQTGGLLSAVDAKTGKPLWTLVVYDNRRKIEGLEGDVQDVFFASMAFNPEGRLVVTDETGRRFSVDVEARTSSPLP